MRLCKSRGWSAQVSWTTRKLGHSSVSGDGSWDPGLLHGGHPCWIVQLLQPVHGSNSHASKAVLWDSWMSNKFLDTPALVNRGMYLEEGAPAVRSELEGLDYHQGLNESLLLCWQDSAGLPDSSTRIWWTTLGYPRPVAVDRGRTKFLEHAWRIMLRQVATQQQPDPLLGDAGGIQLLRFSRAAMDLVDPVRGRNRTSAPRPSVQGRHRNDFKPDPGQSGPYAVPPFCRTQTNAGRYRNQGQDPPSVYCGGLRLSKRRHSTARSSRLNCLVLWLTAISCAPNFSTSTAA